MVQVQAVPPSISEGVQWYLIRFLEIRRDIDLPCACHLFGSWSVWPNRFLSIYVYRLKGGGGCPCVMERAHIIALKECT